MMFKNQIKLKQTENWYSSFTDTILEVKQKPNQLKITEVMRNTVNCSEIAQVR